MGEKDKEGAMSLIWLPGFLFGSGHLRSFPLQKFKTRTSQAVPVPHHLLAPHHLFAFSHPPTPSASVISIPATSPSGLQSTTEATTCFVVDALTPWRLTSRRPTTLQVPRRQGRPNLQTQSPRRKFSSAMSRSIKLSRSELSRSSLNTRTLPTKTESQTTKNPGQSMKKRCADTLALVSSTSRIAISKRLRLLQMQ